VTLIDDDDIPPGVLEIVTVFEVVLQSVDGDDAAVEVGVFVTIVLPAPQSTFVLMRPGNFRAGSGAGIQLPPGVWYVHPPSSVPTLAIG
jgi:hypothetical protein